MKIVIVLVITGLILYCKECIVGWNQNPKEQTETGRGR